MDLIVKRWLDAVTAHAEAAHAFAESDNNATWSRLRQAKQDRDAAEDCVSEALGDKIYKFHASDKYLVADARGVRITRIANP